MNLSRAGRARRSIWDILNYLVIWPSWFQFCAGLAGVLATGHLFWFAAGTLTAIAVALTPVSAT